MISLGQKWKIPKTCEKPFHKIIRVVLCKKPLKKPQMFEKWDDFENLPSCKGYSLCKGYNFCKMGSLGQKLKILETCGKAFYKNIRVVLCKKPLEKTLNIRKMGRFWKSAILQRL